MIENIFHGLTMRKGTLKKKLEDEVNDVLGENHAMLMGFFFIKC